MKEGRWLLLRVAVWMAAQREPAGKALCLLGAAMASCIDIHTGKRIDIAPATATFCSSLPFA